MIDPQSDMSLLPKGFSGTGTPEGWASFWYDDGKNGDAQFGLIPYGAGGFGDSYYYLDFTLTDLTLRLNEARRGVMSCAKPPTEKGYQSYEFALVARGLRYRIDTGSNLYMSPNLYGFNVSSPRIH